jgi:hypothetical protein
MLSQLVRCPPRSPSTLCYWQTSSVTVPHPDSCQYVVTVCLNLEPTVLPVVLTGKAMSRSTSTSSQVASERNVCFMQRYHHRGLVFICTVLYLFLVHDFQSCSLSTAETTVKEISKSEFDLNTFVGTNRRLPYGPFNYSSLSLQHLKRVEGVDG